MSARRDRVRRREVADVPEPRKPDDRLDRLLHVRKQRLGRLERERNEARQLWRTQRDGLRTARLERRSAVAQAETFWQEARAGFLSMATTSGEFRVAKSRYARMKEHAATCYLRWRETLDGCDRSRQEFFAALAAVRAARMQQEKLGMLRDDAREQARRAGED